MRSVTIVGAGLAGLSSARALREQSYDGRITLVGDEPHQPYDRPPLSKEFLAGTVSATDIMLVTPDDATLDLDWRLGRSVARLDPTGAVVVLDNGERIATDGVVIATGARARRLPGQPLLGVHTLRSIDDALALREELLPGARLVVIGAGFVGAEVASTARGLGVEVIIVEVLPTPLAAALGPELGAVCAELHADHGVRLITGVGGVQLLGEDRVHTVRLGDGRELPADLVVVGIGAMPAIEWLAGSGLANDSGVLTNERCATVIPAVVAVGDCACFPSRDTGELERQEHWNNALKQPSLAVATLLGREHIAPSSASVPYFWSDQYGARLQFAGHRSPDNRVEIVEGDTESRSFVAVYRRDEQPVAVLAMNRSKSFGQWRRRLATPAALSQLG